MTHDNFVIWWPRD